VYFREATRGRCIVFLVKGLYSLCSITLHHTSLILRPSFPWCHSSLQLINSLHLSSGKRDQIKLLICCSFIHYDYFFKPIAPDENTAFAKWVLQTPSDCTVLGWCERHDRDEAIFLLKSWRVSVTAIRLPAPFNDYYNNNEDILWTSFSTAHLLHAN